MAGSIPVMHAQKILSCAAAWNASCRVVRHNYSIPSSVHEVCHLRHAPDPKEIAVQGQENIGGSIPNIGNVVAA